MNQKQKRLIENILDAFYKDSSFEEGATLSFSNDFQGEDDLDNDCPKSETYLKVIANCFIGRFFNNITKDGYCYYRVEPYNKKNIQIIFYIGK